MTEDGKDPFPEAEVRPTGAATSARFLQSKMWWVTLLCLLIAIFLSWQSHRPTGTSISIEFPEGHGLKVGDALQHRGIDIGIVTSLDINEDLDGVHVTVEVDNSAVAVANAKSRFWIVRPLLSLTNISGLETAVGSKYIAVDPGPPGSPAARLFVGLRAPPATDLANGGMEITLSSDESHGISPGSPVAYRGVEVGQIVSVNLAKDAQSVTFTAQVHDRFKPLLRRGTKFWKTSGVDVDFGLKGIHLSTESLATMARGGVSFANPEADDDSERTPVASGHEYKLHEAPEKSWLRSSDPITLP